MRDVFPKAHSVKINRECYESGWGPEQDELGCLYSVEVVFPEGSIIYGNLISFDSDSFWFDANHWGNNRWQIDVLEENGVPFVEG